MPSKEFGQLLKGAINSIATYDDTNAPVIEDQLGALIGVSGATIQRYKSGHIPPETRTVKILAEAAIKRGYLNREWLQRFLHAARYPAPEKLVDQLCPPETVRERLPRVYENLPAPIYSQFVMREQAFAEIVEGLNRRSAVVLLASLGGMGKTSLAREIAARCLQGGSDVPQFDAAVWVSDKDCPGTTTFSTVLDTIAQTLDFPGFTQYAHDEKQYEVEQLLRRQRVLLVIDNAETITDGVLLKWILRQLPAPSKALVTAREYRREFRDGAIPIELRGMNDGEARELIADRLVVLKMDKAVRDLDQLEPLIRVTGGNPKAIEMAMGLLKYQRQPLQQIIGDFYAARGNLFDDLFTRAWSLLDEAARRILLVTPLFVDSASEEALAITADVHGFACTRAVEQLADLALLDVQQVDLGSPVRYTTHRLVRAFAGSKLSERKTFENEARERWVEWALGVISRVGNCFDDDPKFDSMDPDQRTCYAAIEWASENEIPTNFFQRLDRAECYYVSRGYFDTMIRIDLLWARAANRISDPIEEFRGIAAHFGLAIMQNNIEEAEKVLPRMQYIAASGQLPDKELLKHKHKLALYWMALGDKERAYKLWKEALEFQEQYNVNSYIDVRLYLANCLYSFGEVSKAKDLLAFALKDAVARVDKLNIVNAQLALTEIALSTGDLQDAGKRLLHLSKIKHAHRDHIAQRHKLQGRYCYLSGDITEALHTLGEAANLFERLGMRRDLAEVQAELELISTNSDP